MAKITPQGMKTNYKTRLTYVFGKAEGVPCCITKHSLCKNYPKKCDSCVRIQGKYSEFKEK